MTKRGTRSKAKAKEREGKWLRRRLCQVLLVDHLQAFSDAVARTAAIPRPLTAELTQAVKRYLEKVLADIEICGEKGRCAQPGQPSLKKYVNNCNSTTDIQGQSRKSNIVLRTCICHGELFYILYIFTGHAFYILYVFTGHAIYIFYIFTEAPH